MWWIIEVNNNLEGDAAIINQDTENTGWIFKLKIKQIKSIFLPNISNAFSKDRFQINKIDSKSISYTLEVAKNIFPGDEVEIKNLGFIPEQSNSSTVEVKWRVINNKPSSNRNYFVELDKPNNIYVYGAVLSSEGNNVKIYRLSPLEET